jgi:anthranilate synthase component 2
MTRVGHRRLRALIVDNYDSFVYNLVQELGALGVDPLVYRNDALSADAALVCDPDVVLVSPGPGRPESAGISNELVGRLAGIRPILGVCLGHQCIGQVFGGQVVRAPTVMHGKVSLVYHDGQGVLTNLPNPFEATRYHSLVVDRSSLPKVLEVTAETDDGVVMALRHRHYQTVEGVQFHPESILTRPGRQLLANFLGMSSRRRHGSDLALGGPICER